MGDQPSLEAAKLTFEREKWEADQRRLDREFALREREIHAKEQEARRARIWNPLAIAILGAAVAAAGNAYVSWQSGQASIQLETFKAESARIFEMIKTGNPDVAAKNLEFLLAAGLIQSRETTASLKNYLRGRQAGEGIALPALTSPYPTTSVSVLGLTAQSVTPDTAHRFGLDKPEGVWVTGVVLGSAAYNAGIRTDDVILSVNNVPIIRDLGALSRAAAQRPLDKTLSVELLRQGQRKVVHLPAGLLQE